MRSWHRLSIGFSRLVLAAILFAAPLALCSPAQAATWKAGTARAKITPEQPLWMSGYASRDHVAEGTLHDLWAKVLVIEDPQGQRLALVTLDLVGIDRQFGQQTCQKIEQQFGLARRQIVLATSHTHTGPVIGENLRPMYQFTPEQLNGILEYTRSTQAKIIETVGAAINDLAPATLDWSGGEATFAVNRRNNSEADVPQRRAEGKLVGPVDHDVPVLRVKDADGDLKAIIFGYACHATTLSFYQWSGDYPGFAQLVLEKANPGATAMFFAGCGADQNPIPRRTVADAERYGEQLALAVQTVLEGTMTPIASSDSSPGVASIYAEVPIPFADLPTRDELTRDSQSSDRYVASRASFLLAKLDAGESLSPTYPYPVQTWRLGPELAIVWLGGEVVVDYSLRLKRELGPAVWVAAYSNDVMAYIPSRRVLGEGGYEGGGAMVYYGLPTIWAPEIEEKIVSEVTSQVRKLRGK